jgi:hypothetical protein
MKLAAGVVAGWRKNAHTDCRFRNTLPQLSEAVHHRDHNLTPHRRRRAFVAKLPSDPLVSARLTFASRVLAQGGHVAGARAKRMSARVDPGLLKAAKIKTGLNKDPDLICAALSVIAASEDFGPWFAAQAGRPPKDFKLDF